MATDTTQVLIIGAGPAGLMLGHLLEIFGIDSILIEARGRTYVESRVRAGVLEHRIAALLQDVGVGERMKREGLVHRGIELQFGSERRRIDFEELTGKTVTVYGQQEVVKDLIATRLAAKLDLRFDTHAVAIDPVAARVRIADGAGRESTIQAQFVAGCDGFHGPSRASVPPAAMMVYDHVFPFSWLGILAESPPVSDELIYANGERGFALVSMRSRTVSRMYLQCANGEDIARWRDEAIWDELRARLSAAGTDDTIAEGRIFQKGVTPMRSFVCDPMRYERLFLAGDSAHIVPPTGAKGMNLAIADVWILARAFAQFFAAGISDGIDRYSETCLRRVWKTQRFSTAMTSLLHRFAHHSPFEHQVQRADFDYLTTSRAAATSLAESYVGLPIIEEVPVVA